MIKGKLLIYAICPLIAWASHILAAQPMTSPADQSLIEQQQKSLIDIVGNKQLDDLKGKGKVKKRTEIKFR
ncbi:hypothetical protein RI049_11685 [Cedecea neteri]|uniref:hypothetical protein n=1 Tax=Cedecea neteri TaxID=158822 RepID=UPI002AA8B05E|nr:hypothetical protein [Cedecea neteri]WPU25354.1 hypothetical protein RI049_11685 [Cedecea neteri]